MKLAAWIELEEEQELRRWRFWGPVCDAPNSLCKKPSFSLLFFFLLSCWKESVINISASNTWKKNSANKRLLLHLYLLLDSGLPTLTEARKLLLNYHWAAASGCLQTALCLPVQPPRRASYWKDLPFHLMLFLQEMLILKSSAAFFRRFLAIFTLPLKVVTYKKKKQVPQIYTAFISS